MPKKAISSLELAAVINELQFLSKGKLTQIYHQFIQKERSELILQIHAPKEGKRLLKIIPGKYLCITNDKDTSLRPSGFTMQLRKYLSNAFVKSISQYESQRIVVFELEKQERFFLIIELFSKGNIILIDEKSKIITALEKQEWKDRSIITGEKYIFPKVEIDWKKITEKELYELLKRSDKKNLATSLAIELGLGGLYAEEICAISGIDKNKLPPEIDIKDSKIIFSALKDWLGLINDPQGYIYEEEITPFPLAGQKIVRKTASYSSALDSINPFEAKSPYQKKIETIKRTLATQEEAVKELEQKIDLNKQKGELIYNYYQPLHKLLEIVNEFKKTKDWSEISKELEKEKKIKNIDLKNKKIAIEL